MHQSFQVEPTTLIDLPTVHSFFAHSIVYQEAKGYPVWRNYDKAALIRDIENKNQYKIVVDSQMAIVFSVRYDDKVIWREMDQNNSVYLHRIVVNPNFKGQKLFGQILSWTIEHAKERNLEFVRMDTWANNQTIIDYYKSFGFKFMGNFTTPDDPGLPQHNRNLALALLEIRV